MRVDVSMQGADEVVRALTYLGKNAPIALQAWARRLLLKVKAAAIQNVSNDILNVRTGILRRWISAQDVVNESTGETSETSWGLPADFGPSVYGAKQEVGGDIFPVNGKLLRVPLPAAMTGQGVDRFQGISFRDKGLPEDMFVLFGKTGNGLIVKKVGKGRNEKLEAWYALVPKVHLNPHPWFSTALDYATAEESPEESIVRALEGLLDGV